MKICDECETVAHCTKHGCIPKVSAKDAAMRLALEALEGSTDKTLSIRAITALRKALAEQPAQQQEPVVFYRCNGCGHAYEQVHPTSCDCMEGSSFEQVNYYTSPQPAQQNTVKRYEPEIFREDRIRMELDSDGDWVKYADVVALIAKSTAQRKPLSVDEIFEAIRPLYSSDKAAWLAVNHSKDEYRAIEAKHGIKENT